MTCRDLQRRLLANPLDASGEVCGHLDGCAECRRVREALAALASAGAARRNSDLSPERVRATRLRVAEILERRREAPAGMPYWTLARVSAWALPVFGAVALVWGAFWGRSREAGMPASSPEIARLDAQIEALSGSLQYAMAEFGQEYLAAEPMPIENRANHLMVDMELCARRLIEDLSVVAVASPPDAGPRR